MLGVAPPPSLVSVKPQDAPGVAGASIHSLLFLDIAGHIAACPFSADIGLSRRHLRVIEVTLTAENRDDFMDLVGLIFAEHEIGTLLFFPYPVIAKLFEVAVPEGRGKRF